MVSTATSPSDINARLARRIEANVGSRRYAMWFDRAARFAYNGDDQTLCVTVPNRFIADRISNDLLDNLRSAAAEELGRPVQVDIRVDAADFQQTAPTPHIAPAATTPRPRKPHTGFQRNLRHSLDDFIVGSSNELAYAAACRLADESSDTHDHHAGDASGYPSAGGVGPLFLHGGCGLGKTHLLQGVCQRLLRRSPHAKVHYTTGEQFTNDYITAVRANRIDEFRRRIRSLDLLAVDDVHFIANKQATQQEFLHSFDRIELGGAKVILASDCHPKLIKQFSEALISRCVRGMVVQINRPDPDTRIRLVEALAQRRGLRLHEGVAQALAGHSDGSVREIEGMLTKLTALASLSRQEGPGRGGVVGHALVRRLLDQDAPTVRSRRPVRFEQIMKGVTEHLGVTSQQVLGRGRHKHVVLARSMVIHLARQLTSMSYPEIATAMGRPNHSTIITAAQRVQKQLAADEPMLLPGDLGQVTPTQLVEQLRGAVAA